MPTHHRSETILSEIENELIKGFIDGLRPVKKLLVSDWANENIVLVASAEPGQYRTSRTPYAKDIMDALSPTSMYNRVVMMKGVQEGITQVALNAVMCHIDISPTPIMYVMPTVEMTLAISKDRVDPIIDNSPAISAKILPSRTRDSGNTQMVKRFPGGFLVFSGANSGASLRSRPVQMLILDEVDGYPISVDNEGSPVSLAENRTTTFGSRRKVFILSTPLNKGTSVIESEYLATDQRKYFVPCPECGYKQELKFDNLKWEKGNYKSVHYVCAECGAKIPERFKTQMFEAGEWLVTCPENISDEKVGFHLNALYSPLGWLSWENIAEKWEKAQGNVNDLRVFMNQILAITWEEKGEAPAWEPLYDRREKYPFNKPSKEVVFITAGADVQKDRIEVEIVGWCKQKRSYSLDYRVLMGDTTSQDVWDKLKAIVNESWERSDGVIMPLRLMAVDTGYNTQHVYQFCRQFDANKVMPIKGQDHQMVIISAPKQVDITIKGKKIGKVRLFHVAVNMLKSEFYGWLRQRIDETTGEVPPGYCHFPEYGPDHFKGLTAEALKPVKTKSGYIRFEWVKTYERNEQLDARVYARAAASIIGMDRWSDRHWDELAQSYEKRTEPVKKKRESSFWKPKDQF